MKNRPEDILPLPAKLLRPEPRQIYPRTRLFERIDFARQSPIVWLSAPGGAGKTVLASSYLRERRLNHQWYQVDGRDEDLASFFHYLGMAARWRAPHLPALPPLTPEYLAGLEAYSRRFFEGLYQRTQPPAMLVLDDYHAVADEAALHDTVRVAASLLPPGINLMVVSRSEPPPPFARLRLHGDLTVLDWQELRLTEEEARGIAELRQGADATPDRIARCHRQSGGWIAGLLLLLDGEMRDGASAAPADADGRGRLFDYFAGEILEKAEPEIQDILLKTALLPRTTVDWAVRLTGVSEAGQVLEALYRRNYFIFRRSEGEVIYEYHPLFRDFLREWASRKIGRDTVRHLENQAADLLEANQLYEEAAELYRAAGNHEAMARLVMEQAGSLMYRGRHAILQTWLDALPEALARSNPWLSYWQGMARFPADPRAARVCFEDAFAGFDEADDPAGLYLAWAAAVETIFIDWNDFKSIDAWLAAFERLRVRHPGFPSPQIEMRVIGAHLAQLYRAPDDPCLPSWVHRAEELLPVSSHPAEAITLVNFLQHYYMWIGALRDGHRVAEVSYASLGNASPLARICWIGLRSVLAWNEGDSREALVQVAKGLQIAQASGVHVWDFLLYAQGIYGGLVAGDLVTAERYVQALEKMQRPTHLLEHSHYFYLSGLLAHQQGDAEMALVRGWTAVEMTSEAGCQFAEMLARAFVALLLFQNAQDMEAEIQLALAEGLAERMQSRCLAYLCALTRARVAMERGRLEELDDQLRTAFALARKAGGLTLSWWGPIVMRRLYARALDSGIELEYVRGIIRRICLTPPDEDCDLWPWRLKVYTLGRFSVLHDDEPLRFRGKAQRKPLELLMALIALGGREVPTGELADALWPDSEGDAAYRSLITTLTRLRHLLDAPEAVVLSGTHLSVNREVLWVDAWACERLMNRSDQAQRDGSPDLARSLFEKAMRFYHRPFLADVAEPWAVSRRERLTAKFRHGVLGHCESLEAEGRQADAIACYLRALEADERAEVFYDRLAGLYRRLGREPEARAVKEWWMKIQAVDGATPCW